MAWSESGMFREWPTQMALASGTGYTGLDSDTIKVSLHDNGTTPNKLADLGFAAYGIGTWAPVHEVTSAPNWAAGGRPLTGKSVTGLTGGIVMFDAADLAAGGTVTLTNAFGCLVYDDSITGGSVADQAVCFNYFGGAQSVTAGSFTLIWNQAGIFRITV